MANHEYQSQSEPTVLQKGESCVLGTEPSGWDSLSEADNETVPEVKILAEVRLGASESAHRLQVLDLRNAPVIEEDFKKSDGSVGIRSVIKWNGFTFNARNDTPYVIVDDNQAPHAARGVHPGVPTILGRGDEASQKRFNFGLHVSRKHLSVYISEDGSLQITNESSTNVVTVLPHNEAPDDTTELPTNLWDEMNYWQPGPVPEGQDGGIPPVNAWDIINDQQQPTPLIEGQNSPASDSSGELSALGAVLANVEEPVVESQEQGDADDRQILRHAVGLLEEGFKHSGLEPRQGEYSAELFRVLETTDDFRKKVMVFAQALAQNAAGPRVLEEMAGAVGDVRFRVSRLAEKQEYAHVNRNVQELVETVRDARMRLQQEESETVRAGIESVQNDVDAIAEDMMRAARIETGAVDSLLTSLGHIDRLLQELPFSYGGNEAYAAQLAALGSAVGEYVEDCKRQRPTIQQGIYELKKIMVRYDDVQKRPPIV